MLEQEEGRRSRGAGPAASARKAWRGGGSLERAQAGRWRRAKKARSRTSTSRSIRTSSTSRRAATLRDNGNWLKDHPQAKVEIEGHCDERGTVEYNLALGAKRARAAKDYLVALGVAADRLTTISYGEELPLCHEHTEECWQKNRRAHFVVLGE